MPKPLAAVTRIAMIVALLAATTVACGRSPAVSVVFIGKILTMDNHNSEAQAASVSSMGRIVRVGSERQVRAGLKPNVPTVTLQAGQTLMPGFVEPHLHLLPTLLLPKLRSRNLAPCLPPPYESRDDADCAKMANIADALTALKERDLATSGDSGAFVFGINLDPSRQPLRATRCTEAVNVAFSIRPKAYLDSCVASDRPVLILDQSGHLGYANDKAFAVVCGGAADCTEPESIAEGGGEWVKGARGDYTGLLREASAIDPFLAAIGKSFPLYLAASDPKTLTDKYLADLTGAADQLRAAGITTVADGGIRGARQLQVDKLLAAQEGFPLRITGVITADTAARDGLEPVGPECDPSAELRCELPRWLGAGGIKLWVDGSTQGCTAKLLPPYEYRDGGHCGGAGEGRADVGGVAQIVEELKGYWADGWRIQMHANGNGANRWAVQALAELQLAHHNPHRALLVHHTVGQESVSAELALLRAGEHRVGKQKAPAVDARVTHLIGHVAYWGDAFGKILGSAAASNIDPIGFDNRYRVPWSLHADSPVTPAQPLWYVQQAVTRQTWSYPELANSYPLGPLHRASVIDALRGITIEPARDHELERWVGSLEPGKVADFVVLGANPLETPAEKLGSIRVIRTFLAGKETGREGTHPVGG